MLNFKKVAYLGINLIVVIALAGCSKAAEANLATTTEPTLDINLIRTQVAQTVIANITVEAALNPSVTPAQEASSPPPQPTIAPPPTETLQVIIDSSPTATLKPVTSSGGGVIYATRTKTPYTDSAKLIDQVPADGYSRKQGETFPAYWEFLNIGMRDWNTDFYIKWVSGDVEPEGGTIYHIPGRVKQQDSVRMDVTLRVPNISGKRNSNWVLINDDGVVIYHFNLQMVVP